MIRLFLNNKEVELNKSVTFAINKQFEDITSPADIKNDWSKTVEIPFTQSNNKLFGELFNVDRLIVEGDSSLMGVYFDPYKKIDFRLQWGDTIIMQGYAKNINVDKKNNGEGTYNITLNGELGKLFQEMNKITFDVTTEDKKYLIDGSKYVNSIVNKDLIHLLWNNEPDLVNLDLTETTDPNYRVQDYIGFIPNNSYNENFDYKTFQLEGSEQSKKFAEELDDKANAVYNQNYEYVTGIAADTVIGEGLLPREIGEYRSYFQIPYIYFNKLFQIFSKKTEELTGYEVEMDSDWFNNTNPYWNKMVYILKSFDSKNEETVTNFYMLSSYGIGWGGDINDYVQPQTTGIDFTDRIEAIQIIDNNNMIELSNDYTIIFNTIYTIEFNIGTNNNLRLNPSNGLQYSFLVKDENSNVLEEVKYLMVDNSYSGSTDGYSEVMRFDRVAAGSFRDYPKLYLVLDKGKYNNIDKVKLELQAVWLNTNAPFLDNNNNPFIPTPSQYTGYVNLHLYNAPTNNPISCKVIKNPFRSNNHFTLNNLWNNEYNIFNEVINYCKQFRIGVFCDDINKKLIYKPLSSYFSNYSILDWTDKLDMSKEYHIQPITFENKYLLFNYEKYATELNNEYNKNFGRNFGEYRLSTDYEFNLDEKELFKYSKVTIPSTDICLSWENLYNNFNIVYTLPAEITAYNKDKDEKNVDVFGSMLFYKGLGEFDTTSAMRPVFVTDDTTLQSLNQVFFYTQKGEEDKYIRSEYYPVLDVVDGHNLCTFAIPSANYTYVKDSYDNKNGIFKNFWEKYLNERYNKQNKIVTCYLRLTPYDIANFQYNNFVKIENQLYMVNKIYDYQVSEDLSTKVDLITIQDIKGYTTNNFY